MAEMNIATVATKTLMIMCGEGDQRDAEGGGTG